ncbi:MAG TPA: hypothetical protein VI876_09560 [Dehalococcoidia bacterium]|nr:hypothetical protein [Dehalococcoidia bacterium]
MKTVTSELPPWLMNGSGGKLADLNVMLVLVEHTTNNDGSAHSVL